MIISYVLEGRVTLCSLTEGYALICRHHQIFMILFFCANNCISFSRRRHLESRRAR